MTAICILAAAQTVSAAPFAYIANSGTNNISVIDTATNAITATVTLPDTNSNPYGITVGSSGQYVYVGLKNTKKIVAIDVSTNTVIRTIDFQPDVPGGLAVNAAETRLYVASNMSNTLSIWDISGPANREVDRKYLGTAEPYQPMTNPEGVVLNSTGTKAYVANSSTDSIAEITLDEVNNVNTVSSIINLGADAHPMGLAISLDGTKLYFASWYGHTGVVDLTASPKTVTTMPTSYGNLSVAVNPVSGNVYAPSFATDKLYAFNSAGTALAGSPFANVTAGPFGSSVTPDGNKLFITMNYGADPNYDVKVYNTASLGGSPLASIPLPLGAKPTSLGNFIGPVWDHIITASATAPCTITPSGTVPVNSHGWKFNISGTGCNVTVNGASVGAVTTYEFNNVIDNTQTISVLQTIPNSHLLNASWISSSGGYLKSTPSGIDQNSPSAYFADGSNVSINAASGFRATSWTGACLGTADGQPCVFNNLTADKTFGATVAIAPAGGSLFNVTKSEYYSTWAACTSSAATYNYIKVSTDPINSTITTDGTAGYQYYLSNQWKSADYTPDTYHPMTLTITNIGVTVDTTAGYTLTL